MLLSEQLKIVRTLTAETTYTQAGDGVITRTPACALDGALVSPYDRDFDLAADLLGTARTMATVTGSTGASEVLDGRFSGPAFPRVTGTWTRP